MSRPKRLALLVFALCFTSGNLTAQAARLPEPRGTMRAAPGPVGPVAMQKQIVDLNGGSVLPGDTLEFTMSLSNSGPGRANSLQGEDPIPANTAYVPGSIVVTSGAGAGAKTDAAGDDAAYVAANVVYFHLGQGASAAAGGFLDPGQATAVRFRVVVGSGVASGTVISNLAYMEYDDAGGTHILLLSNPPGGSSGTPTTVTVERPDLTIAKTHTGDFARGSSGIYTITVSNLGPGTSAGTITVADVLPAGLTPVTATGSGWTCPIVGQTVNCSRTAALTAGASAPAITLTVSVATNAPASLTNIATVSGGGDASPGNNSAADPTTTITPPLDLQIVKTLATSVVAGGRAAWNLTVTNVSSAPTTGTTTVTDVLPAALTFVSATGASCGALGQTVTCTVPAPLAGGQSVVISLSTAVASSATGSVSNTATVATPGDGNAGNNSSTVVIPVLQRVDLAILKRAAGPLASGGTASFSLTVENVGLIATLGPITVTDVLPDGLTFLSATGPGFSCGASGPSVTCTRGAPLGVNQQAVIDLTVRVTGASGTTVVNTARVATSNEVNLGNNESSTPPLTIIAPPIDVAISKALVGGVTAGGEVTFLLGVTNAGSVPAPGPFTLTDVLAPGLTFVGATGADWSCSASGQTVTCTRTAPLPVGGSTSVDLRVRLAAGVTSVSNTATIATPGDSNPSNNVATISPVPVSPAPPDLTVSKTASGPFIVGRPASYTITVRNAGQGATTGSVTVTDVVPAGLSVTGASGAGWNCTVNGQTVVCVHAGALAPGASATLTILVTPTAAASARVTNTATATTPGEANPANNDGTASTDVGQPLDLAADKEGPATVAAGGTATWTLRVRNVGPVASGAAIVLTDTLPAGLTFVSGGGDGFSCTVSGAIVTCTRSAPLAPGAAAVVPVLLRVGAEVTGEVRNVACVHTAGDTQPANDCARQTSSVAADIDLAAVKEAASDLRIGEPGRFTLAVRNLGASPARAPITLTDTLPTGTTFVSASGPGWECRVTGAVVTCVRATDLPAGSLSPAVTLVVEVGPSAFPRLVNCLHVRGANETGSLANNRACVEPAVAGVGRLELEKRVSDGDVQVGDLVSYTLTLRNTGTGPLPDVLVVDDLPRGFLLDRASVRVDGRAASSVEGAPGPRITFPVGLMTAGQQVVISYRLRVGAAAPLGPAVNTARAALRASAGATQATARANVRVVGGVFDERGAIAGKIYMQCACPDARAQGAGDVGIPGVRIYLEDGTSAVTDVEGKYSFYNISSRLHVLTVDRTTLPVGAVLVPLNSRSAGDGYTRFADVKAGELHRADFADGSRDVAVLERVLARRRGGEITNAGERPGTPLAIAGATTASARAYAPLAARGTIDDHNANLPVRPLHASAPLAPRGAARAVRLVLQVADTALPADGVTLVPVRVRLVDADDAPLRGRTDAVTLESSVGTWQGTPPIQTSADGYLVELIDGEALVHLVAPPSAARGEIRATVSGADAMAPVTFLPTARPMLLTGLLNARIDWQSLFAGGPGVADARDGFEAALRDWSFGADSARARGGARAALLMKGTVLDRRLLTLSYDSERERDRTFFRDIVPDEFFPVYGDGALREFDAQSRRRFYGKLEKGAGYLMFGDVQTARADDRRMLTAYDRTLTALVQHGEGARGTWTAFATRGRIRQQVEELPGRGISGPYALSRSTGLVNSERVEIVVRDRNQPAVILSRTPMTRFADYTVEAMVGRLIFRAPVPSLDAQLNPVSIRVTYETEDGTLDDFWIYGAEGAVRAAGRVELGGTLARDEGPIAGHTLAGVHTTARLGAGTTLFAEAGYTEDVRGTTGDAQRIELRHQSAGLDARLFAVRSDSSFSNASSVFAGGRSEVGGRLSARLAESTRLVGEALRSRATLEGERTGALLAIEHQFARRFRGEVGWRYATTEGAVRSPAGFLDQDRDVNAVRVRGQLALGDNARSALFGEVEQDVQVSDRRRLAVGGEYLIAQRARLYGRHELLSGLRDPYTATAGPDRAYTVIGIDADYLRNTQVFSEYRARDAFAGRDIEASIGLRNRWRLAPGLLINTSFERVTPLIASASGVPLQEEALAVTGAVEWTRPERWKSTARLEVRDASGGDHALASFGYARKLSRDWTLLGRTLWDDFDAARRQTRGFSQLGVAWRETDRNRWNAVARYEHRFDRVGGQATLGPTRDQTHLVAALLNYQPVPRLTLTSRYAARRSATLVDGADQWETAQLLMGRGVLDLNRRLDAGVIANSRFTDGFAERRYGLGVELGAILARNLRLAGGWNLFGFNDRTSGSLGTTRRGPYVEFGFKLDETLFGIGTPPSAGRQN